MLATRPGCGTLTTYPCLTPELDRGDASPHVRESSAVPAAARRPAAVPAAARTAARPATAASLRTGSLRTLPQAASLPTGLRRAATRRRPGGSRPIRPGLQQAGLPAARLRRPPYGPPAGRLRRPPGSKPTKKWYQRWWVWVIIVVVALLVIAAVAFGVNHCQRLPAGVQDQGHALKQPGHHRHQRPLPQHHQHRQGTHLHLHRASSTGDQQRFRSTS